VSDGTVAAWIQAACATEGVTVLATSRWQIPGWEGEHLALGRANYGDFLQMAQGLALQKSCPLNANNCAAYGKHSVATAAGLEFFAGASQSLPDENAEAGFSRKDWSRLRPNCRRTWPLRKLSNTCLLLQRNFWRACPAYHEAVPEEGLLKLALDLPEAETALERLWFGLAAETSYRGALGSHRI